MKFEFNDKALRELEKKLSATVQVPTDGSESDAIREVKRQYKKATGIELTTEAARNLVRQARKR
ncbi:hypothetical protein [Nocardia brasiliensis]|uniref:hypothetical protein n=1 Tax=Nocardia brasiliensis TaxID=37326 RepID=UPI0018954752|nr:hypothetical protein [Nocardia brasiliensis]MBF6546973.1 hypothetical protein [Nocardia brasiliensis]